MMGRRQTALPLRERIEAVLSCGGEVALDFSGIEATQSFIDELVGVLVLKQGPTVLEQVLFKGCSESVIAIVRFVVADRARQFKRRAH